MRVAFYCGLIGERKTGAGVHAWNLLHQLAELRPDIEYVSFLPSLRHSGAHQAMAGLLADDGRIQARTVPVPARILHASETYLRLPPLGLLLGGTYDVYHQMEVISDPVVPDRKLVVSMHDVVSLFWAGHEAPLFRRAAHLLRRTAAVITLSEHSRRSIVGAFNVDPDRVHVIHCGVDHSIYNTNHKPTDIDLALDGLGVTKPYMLYIGGQTPRKNLGRLVAGFARARREAHLPHSLVLAGPLSASEPALKMAIAASGAAEAIKLLGYVPDEALPYLYRGADFLLFPSLYEGFGLPVLEAMACGTPVVTSSTTSLPEVAGDAAVFVDPESVSSITTGILIATGESRQARAARIDRGIAQAQSFSWRRCAEEHLAVYETLAQKGGNEA